MKISNYAVAFAVSSIFANSALAFDDITVDQFVITPYARLVAGLNYTTNLMDGGVDGDRWQAAANQWGTSYAGIKIRTELTNNWSAIANLESGFGTDDGSVNTEDTLFDRAANVGVVHPMYGSLTGGTHLVLGQDISSMDPMGFQAYGLNSLTNGVNDGVSTSSILYRSKEFGGVSFSYMHEFGGVVGDDERSSGDAAELSFDKGNFGVKAIYQLRKDKYGRYSGGEFYGLGSNSQWINVKNFVVGASYDFGPGKLFAGYDSVKAPETGYAQSLNMDSEANIYWTGINYNLTNDLTLLAAYYRSDLDDSGKKSDLYSVGVNYDWTELVKLYATVGYIGNNSISSEAASGAGASNHALDYTDIACESTSDCNGASQFGTYIGMAISL